MFSASALIQRDGDVVALDGVSNLQVGGVPAGNYYVAIGHRNHHKVRSSSTLALSSSNTAYDFTTALGQAYDNPGVTTNDAMFAFADGNYGMLGGDANYDAKTSYIGGNNDRGAILLLLGGAGGVENDYMSEDVNMNAKVSYIGANNDRGSILLMLGSAGGVANAHVTN